MMNYIWGFLTVISIICAFLFSNVADVSSAVISGAEESINFVLKLTGMMCLWCGIMNIAEKSGVVNILSKMFSPIYTYLFPKYKNDKSVKSAVCSNITANLLGLGNAATPLGVEAMKRMKAHNPSSSADDEMMLFVVLNTASVQIIPVTIGMIRSSNNAANPFDILPCVLISSFAGLVVGVISAKIMGRKR